MPQVSDIPSVSSAYFVANLTLALVMVYARATRRVYPGFNDWMASQVVLVAGVMLLSGAAYLSPWLSLLVGNSLLMLAQVFVYTGCIRFFDLPRHLSWPYYGLLAIAVAGFVWLVGTNSSASLRSLAFSLFTAVMMARITVALITQKKPRRDPSVLALLTAAFFAMVFFSARALILWYAGAETDSWNQRLLAAAFYVGIVFSILLVFSFLQLVQARTERELHAAQAKAEQMANIDPLTGAWNRRRFENEAEREIARAVRYRADAGALAHALCTDIALRDFRPAGKVTLSAGVAEYRPPESLQAWLARADRGMYGAKAQGGRAHVVMDVEESTASSANL